MEIFLFVCFLLLVYGYFASKNNDEVKSRPRNTNYRNSGRNSSRSHSGGSPVLTFKVTVNEVDRRIPEQRRNYSKDPLIYIGTNLTIVADTYWSAVDSNINVGFF